MPTAATSKKSNIFQKKKGKKFVDSKKMLTFAAEIVRKTVKMKQTVNTFAWWWRSGQK